MKMPKKGGIAAVVTTDAVTNASNHPEAKKAAIGQQKGLSLMLDVSEFQRIDRARAKAGRLSRRAWIRLAISEKLERAGE